MPATLPIWASGTSAVMLADNELDALIRSTLTAFTDSIFASGWRGREREAVSLYAAGFLQPLCNPGGPLRDPTQVAIEVTVPPAPGHNPKGRVNKDLVLWPEPRMTVWDSDWKVKNVPLAILEWKVFRSGMRGAPAVSTYDLEWLKSFSGAHPQFVGYAVTVNLVGRPFRMRVARCYGGAAQLDWLNL